MQVDWTLLTNSERRHQPEIRVAEVRTWEIHDYVLEGPERFAQRTVNLESDETPRE